MRQRLALAVSSVVAAGVLAVGLSAAGFDPNVRTTASDDDLEIAQASGEDLTEPNEPEVVYVKPAPSPKTVVKVKRTKAKDGDRTTRRTTRVRSEDRDDDHDDERDDERERKRERRNERDRDDDHEREDEDDD